MGNLNEKGFVIKFGGGKCEITDPNGEIVGEVPKNDRGLYRVGHHPETADAVMEELTLDQLHRQMGHISSKRAQKLVSDGLVTGIF